MKNTVGIVLSYMPKRNVPVLSLSKTYSPDMRFFKKQSICYAGKPMLSFRTDKTEGILSWLGMYQIDIIGMDDEFGKRDPEYQPELALYQGKTCSMDGYIEQKFGKRYVQIINAMMN